MPRAITYGRRRAAAVHLDALVADHPGAVPQGLRDSLVETSHELAADIEPEAVRPYYVARLASEPDALHSANRDELWRLAAQDAKNGVPLPAGAESRAKALAQEGPSAADGPLEKLAKYVPAELITLTTLAFAALKPTGSDVWWLLTGGAVANVLYLLGAALHARKETKEMPPWYFYLLSGAALFLWAIAVIPIVGREFGISGSNAETRKTFALAFAAFSVPLVDMIVTGITEWLGENTKLVSKLAALKDRMTRKPGGRQPEGADPNLGAA